MIYDCVNNATRIQYIQFNIIKHYKLFTKKLAVVNINYNQL